MINNRIISISILLLLVHFSFCQTTKVLFLGNSYTASNNLPEMFFNLSESLGDSVYYDSNTPGGTRLMNHATNATTLSKISSEDWDFVVLQGQSQEASLDPATLEQDVFPYASILNDSIKANNACTETVFFMTWGRKYGDLQNCADWPPVCTFLGMQERLMAGYMLMTEDNEATVAPVGLAWKQAMDFDPDSLINLYSMDNSHPSPAGSYLTACVMYATMFHRSPEGSSYIGTIPENQASYLQQIAFDVVFGNEYSFLFYDPYFEINFDLSWLDWFKNGSVVIADFSIATNGATYYFTNQSFNAESYLWDFGDGTTSILENPSHTYEESGQYVVSHSAYNTCFSDISLDTLNVIVSEVQQIFTKNQISLFQYPDSKIFDVSFECDKSNQTMKVEVLDNKGMIIIKDFGLCNKGVNTVNINLSSHKTGVYYLRILLDNEVVIKKIILN